MTDIEKLIERLRQHERFAGNIVVEAADALTRLVAPLPAEVEAMVRNLRTHNADYEPIARMLESLARENARLAAEKHPSPPSGGEKADPAGKCVFADACRHYPPETCPVHAPKPAAEKP